MGGTWTHDDALTLVGNALEVSALVLKSRGVDLEAREIVDLLTDRVLEQLRDTVPWRPGAQALLRDVRDAGIPTALVTMSLRRMADAISEVAGAAFDVVVAGDQVEHGKPDPEAYLTAASRLGVEAGDCVAIEDSEVGVAAAVASGASTIAVPSHLELPASAAYTLWPTLEGRGVADLAALHARRRAA
ncbi:haloacid dehalogenase [Pseudolysinimonas kribbensis]|uniref:Haloacid dehalogenase n=1 Tax=Pseudolysinimonas kribbensis TaxID=433641 RepID=A0ABQ6KD09_9MICO|nr:haloacid dehalogenase [Pseudolysinimonas kribbensis]GMA97158.1 haloacid dehalogenase [Pseudolysinimonas kribbensis]